MTVIQKLRLLQTHVSVGSYQHILNTLLEAARHRPARSDAPGNLNASNAMIVCIANVHMLIEAVLKPDFATLLNRADVVTTDGKPLCMLLKALYGIRQERVAGPDLMVDLFREAEKQGLKVFFYGSRPEVLEALTTKLGQDFPNLKIAGAISPPFRPLSPKEHQADLETIRQSQADLVFVALGCPKQEQWMADNQQALHAVLIGVGAAFPFYTGQLKRAPRWMQQACLEWLYRLLQEPRRLLKRYAVTNTLFLLLAAKAILSKRVFQK